MYERRREWSLNFYCMIVFAGLIWVHTVYGEELDECFDTKKLCKKKNVTAFCNSTYSKNVLDPYNVGLYNVTILYEGRQTAPFTVWDLDDSNGSDEFFILRVKDKVWKVEQNCCGFKEEEECRLPPANEDELFLFSTISQYFEFLREKRPVEWCDDNGGKLPCNTFQDGKVKVLTRIMPISTMKQNIKFDICYFQIHKRLISKFPEKKKSTDIPGFMLNGTTVSGPYSTKVNCTMSTGLSHIKDEKNLLSLTKEDHTACYFVGTSTNFLKSPICLNLKGSTADSRGGKSALSAVLYIIVGSIIVIIALFLLVKYVKPVIFQSFEKADAEVEKYISIPQETKDQVFLPQTKKAKENPCEIEAYPLIMEEENKCDKTDQVNSYVPVLSESTEVKMNGVSKVITGYSENTEIPEDKERKCQNTGDEKHDNENISVQGKYFSPTDYVIKIDSGNDSKSCYPVKTNAPPIVCPDSAGYITKAHIDENGDNITLCV